MNFINVNDNIYDIDADGFSIRLFNAATDVNGNQRRDYSANTGTSEELITSYIDIIKSITKTEHYVIYNNQNYITFDTYDCHFYLYSNVDVNNIINSWMYPLYGNNLYTNTNNFPKTDTISIIINSNTLPVYNIENDITVSYIMNSTSGTITIPAGKHSYSTVNDIFKEKNINTISDVNQYKYIQYFMNSRLIYDGDQSLIFVNNEEFDKYYGLLHMIMTYPANTELIGVGRKFSNNMAPVYRSLHIPEGKYLPNDFVNYIKENSEYHYERNGVQSLSYTQFLAKIVDNDIVIYTTDGTEFFINPICKMNTYQETNFASEHKLCPCSEGIKWDNLNKRYFIGDTVNITGTLVGPFEGLSATGLPDGLSFDPVTCSITGTISKDNKVGEYTITISTTTIDDPLVFNIYVDTRKYLIYYK